MRVLVVGATSAIAGETCRAFAEKGARLFLTARSRERLETMAEDLTVRGAERVGTAVLDLTDVPRHAEVLAEALDELGSFDAVLLAAGVLPDQAACERSVELTLDALEVDFTAAVAFLTLVAQALERQGSGVLAVISSVAGERGRRSNYVYGAAKGGLSVFLQGLRSRLHRHGVGVLTVKPGPVDTPMTAALPKNLLYADPRTVGRAIQRAIEQGNDVVYLPWFWRPVMAVLGGLPEALFKRLGL